MKCKELMTWFFNLLGRQGMRDGSSALRDHLPGVGGCARGGLLVLLRGERMIDRNDGCEGGLVNTLAQCCVLHE